MTSASFLASKMRSKCRKFESEKYTLSRSRIEEVPEAFWSGFGRRRGPSRDRFGAFWGRFSMYFGIILEHKKCVGKRHQVASVFLIC